MKLIRLRVARLDLAGPARGEGVGLHRRTRRACAPIEIDRRIHARTPQGRKVDVVVKGPAQSCAAAYGKWSRCDDELRFVRDDRLPRCSDLHGIKPRAAE
jgi:hypothetical protein